MLVWEVQAGDLSRRAPLSMLNTTCWPTNAAAHSWGVTASGGTSIGHKGMMYAAKVMAAAEEGSEEPEAVVVSPEEERKREIKRNMAANAREKAARKDAETFGNVPQNTKIDDMDRCRRLLIISMDIGDDLVARLNAQPIEMMNFWYRFAMWDTDNVVSD